MFDRNEFEKLIAPQTTKFQGIEIGDEDLISLPVNVAANQFVIKEVIFTPAEWLTGHIIQVAKQMQISREEIEAIGAALRELATENANDQLFRDYLSSL